MATILICSIPNCDKPQWARGWCGMHYQRWTSHGDPLAVVRHHSGWRSVQRFFVGVVLPYDGEVCLLWPFNRNKQGYARIRAEGRMQYAHRIVCELVNGPPPTPAHEAAHNCGRGHEGCVAPNHIRWATSCENNADKLAHGTHNRGSRHVLSKLTATEVKQIRFLKRRISQQQLGEMFGVSKGLVSKIQRRKNWAWLE